MDDGTTSDSDAWYAPRASQQPVQPARGIRIRNAESFAVVGTVSGRILDELRLTGQFAGDWRDVPVQTLGAREIRTFAALRVANTALCRDVLQVDRCPRLIAFRADHCVLPYLNFIEARHYEVNGSRIEGTTNFYNCDTAYVESIVITNSHLATVRFDRLPNLRVLRLTDNVLSTPQLLRLSLSLSEFAVGHWKPRIKDPARRESYRRAHRMPHSINLTLLFQYSHDQRRAEITALERERDRRNALLEHYI